MTALIEISGILLILLALLHAIFPSYFKWKEELNKLSLINRQIMWVHTFFIALMLFLMGLLCITSAYELYNSALGKRISLGFSIFWLFRLFIQFFGYSPSLWKGKLFESTVHVVFSIFWLHLTLIFGFCAVM